MTDAANALSGWSCARWRLFTSIEIQAINQKGVSEMVKRFAHFLQIVLQSSHLLRCHSFIALCWQVNFFILQIRRTSWSVLFFGLLDEELKIENNHTPWTCIRQRHWGDSQLHCNSLKLIQAYYSKYLKTSPLLYPLLDFFSHNSLVPSPAWSPPLPLIRIPRKLLTFLIQLTFSSCTAPT